MPKARETQNAALVNRVNRIYQRERKKNCGKMSKAVKTHFEESFEHTVLTFLDSRRRETTIMRSLRQHPKRNTEREDIPLGISSAYTSHRKLRGKWKEKQEKKSRFQCPP